MGGMEMKLKSVSLFMLLPTLMLLLAACGDSQPLPDIDATVEGLLTEVPTLMPTPAPTPTKTPAPPNPTDPPTLTPWPTQPAPTEIPRMPTATSNPTPLPTTISGNDIGSAPTVSTPVATANTSAPVGLAALCSLDQEAARITCHSSGVSQATQSQLTWESNISSRETGPTYEISIDEWVHAVIVTLELCQGTDCEKVETYIDTAWVTPGKGKGESANATPSPTEVSPTPPTSGTSSQIPTPTVVETEFQTNDRLFDGTYPCTEDNTRAFTASIVPTNLLTKIEPLGKMADSHVTPTDHLYVHWARPVSGTTEYVVAPADGQIVEISRFPSDNVVRYDSSIIVPDYRMVLMHSCAFFTIFIHMAELAPAIAEQTGPIPLGGRWSFSHSGPIEVKAGDPLSKISSTGLDWSVHDADVTLSGFVVPEHYVGEPWKIHTVDPFQFYEEPLRSELLSKVVRKVEPRAGKIDYDIEDTILGNWFLEGTIDYGGNTDDSEYWKGHLAIAYGWIDPSQVRISIGFDTGIDDQLCNNVCFSAFGVRGNQPDPVTVGKEAGLVKYELMSRQGPYSEQVGKTALGTFLVQHLGDRTIRVELITGKSPQEVTGFSIAARIYHR